MAPNASWPERFTGHDYPQSLPEPLDIRPGAPAPWSGVAASNKRGLTLNLVEARLRDAQRHLELSPLPVGPLAMAAVGDATKQPITRRSAVLVALFEEAGETHVILTRRSFAMRLHRGEIALPGGTSDDDETPMQTALREAREEVGLDESLVSVVGWLNPIVTFAFASAIWPIVGLLEGRPTLVADPGEVDRVFTVSLADLLREGAFLEEQWRRDVPRPGVDDDGYFPIYLFAVPGDLVWGATARVLTELLCVVTQVEWPEAKRVSA